MISSFFLRSILRRGTLKHSLSFPLPPSFLSVEPSLRTLPKSLSSAPSKPYSFLVSSEDFVSSFPSFSGSFGCSASLDAAGRVSVSCSSPTEADSSEVTSASRKCEKASIWSKTSFYSLGRQRGKNIQT